MINNSIFGNGSLMLQTLQLCPNIIKKIVYYVIYIMKMMNSN